MERLTRVKNAIVDKWNYIVEFLSPAVAYTRDELLYLWKSICSLMSWRVPFLNWVRMSPVLDVCYGAYLIAMSFAYFYRGTLLSDGGYLEAGFLYIVIFMWFGLFLIERFFGKKMLQIHKEFGNNMSEIAGDLLREHKALIVAYEDLLTEREAEKAACKSPSPLDIAPDAPAEPINETQS